MKNKSFGLPIQIKIIGKSLLLFLKIFNFFIFVWKKKLNIARKYYTRLFSKFYFHNLLLMQLNMNITDIINIILFKDSDFSVMIFFGIYVHAIISYSSEMYWHTTRGYDKIKIYYRNILRSSMVNNITACS